MPTPRQILGGLLQIEKPRNDGFKILVYNWDLAGIIHREEVDSWHILMPVLAEYAGRIRMRKIERSPDGFVAIVLMVDGKW